MMGLVKEKDSSCSSMMGLVEWKMSKLDSLVGLMELNGPTWTSMIETMIGKCSKCTLN